jgi:hypothetical protein
MKVSVGDKTNIFTVMYAGKLHNNIVVICIPQKIIILTVTYRREIHFNIWT